MAMGPGRTSDNFLNYNSISSCTGMGVLHCESATVHVTFSITCATNILIALSLQRGVVIQQINASLY